MVFKDQLNWVYLKTKSVILLDESPWPIVISIGTFTLLNSAVCFFFKDLFSGFIINFPLYMGRIGGLIMLYGIYLWIKDVIREGTFLRRLSDILENSLKYAMVLFIISEVMFFFAFFWSFFHTSLSPSVEIGNNWPPKFVGSLSFLDIPLLNTIILLFSGITVTVSHNSLINGKLKSAKFWLAFTIFSGVVFLFLQSYEYFHSSYNIKLGVYGSVFFVTTGFHGFHVFLGVLLLGISLSRMRSKEFTSKDHFSFVAAAWYYHFVDVVWLFLYVFFYYWID